MMQNVLDLAAVRAQHTLLLLQLLWHEDLSRVDLSRRVGLSRSAISSIVAELMAAGLVLEVGQRAAGGVGRRATLLRLNAGAVHLLAVDLGASHLRVALLDLRCRILHVLEEPCDVLQGPAATYALLWRLTDQVLAEAGASLGSVAGLGIGVPGPVDHHTGRVVQPPNMRGWDGENIAAAVAARYPVPVLVDNGANLGALAEWRFGAQRGTADLIYLKVATGVGAGVLLGSRLHRGARGGAGEVGHISINEAGPPGRSGNPGSLESYVAAGVLLDQLQARLGGHGSSLLHPHSTVQDLIRHAERDPIARELWAEVGRHLGVGVTIMLNLFNPEALVIGGALAAAGAPLLAAVREVVAQRALLINREQLSISLSTLGADVGVLGAGAMLVGELFTPRYLPHLYAVGQGQRGGGALPSSRAPPPLTARAGGEGSARRALPGRVTASNRH